MNFKNKFISFFIFLSILTISILNIKNPEKTKFYLFTSKIEELSLGNLITITFISGFTFSSILTLITKNNSHVLLENNSTKDEEIDNCDRTENSQEFEYDRPPERDVRESQPTISVNYRFVDQDRNSNDSKIKINNLNNENNDWLNNEDEW